MHPNETALTAQEVQNRLAERRGNKVMHYNTLTRAIRRNGLPAHPNPFGRGFLFYWSEVDNWLATLPTQTVRRAPGRLRQQAPANLAPSASTVVPA